MTVIVHIADGKEHADLAAVVLDASEVTLAVFDPKGHTVRPTKVPPSGCLSGVSRGGSIRFLAVYQYDVSGITSPSTYTFQVSLKGASASGPFDA